MPCDATVCPSPKAVFSSKAASIPARRSSSRIHRPAMPPPMIITQRAIHFDLPQNAIWIGLGLGAVVAFTMTLINRPDSKTAAVAIDERLNLKDKFSTALSVRSTPDPFAQAVVRDAENTAQGVKLAGHFGVPFPIAGYWAIAAIVITILVAMFFPSLDL